MNKDIKNMIRKNMEFHGLDTTNEKLVKEFETMFMCGALSGGMDSNVFKEALTYFDESEN